MNTVEIGMRIKEQRKKAGYTQTQIHQLTGISSGNLSSIENGAVSPSASALCELARVLKCSIDYLLLGNSSNIKNQSSSNTEEFSEEFIERFQLLDDLDKEEILDIIEMKIRRKKRLAKSSASNNSATSEAV